MKLKRMGISIMCAVAAFASVFSFGACGVFRDDPTHVVSYLSVDSEVYSTTADIVKAVADSVVEIETELITTQWGMKYVSSGAGSGVIVGRDGDYDTYYIVTNNHVIDGATQIRVALRSGDKYDARLIATDVRGDIAVISIEESQTLNIATWGNSDTLQVGEDLIAIGNPLGSLGGTVTKGILSSTARSIAVGSNTMTLLQTDTAINPGNSGGGLFNMRGELIGVVNAKTSDEQVEGICFAIPANTARSIFTELLENGYVAGRVSLGISVAVNNYGVYVTATEAGSEFELNDIVYAINGNEISSLLVYNDTVAALAPGDSVKVDIYRRHATSTMFGVQYSYTPATLTVTAKQLK